MAKFIQKSTSRKRKPMTPKGGYTANSERRYGKGGKLSKKKCS